MDLKRFAKTKELFAQIHNFLYVITIAPHFDPFVLSILKILPPSCYASYGHYDDGTIFVQALGLSDLSDRPFFYSTVCTHKMYEVTVPSIFEIY